MPKKVTIQDVADHLGVTKSAVSHALSGRRRISPELSKRVEIAVKELGYRPNFAAQVMNSHSTGLIGVAVYDISNTQTVALLHELSRELKKAGNYSLTLCLCNTLEKADGIDLLRRISNGMVDAIINMLPQLTVEEAEEAARPTPTLTYQRHTDSPITLPYQRGVEQALDHLWELGHRRIGMISTLTRNFGSEDPCLVAYRDYLTRRGAFDPALIRQCFGDTAGGHQAAMELSKEHPSAILCGNDVIAAGVLQWAHEQKLRLPEELSVIGSDNSALAGATYPMLTSIDMFMPKVAAHTAQVLLAMVSGGEKPAPAVIEPKLIIRNSTGPYIPQQGVTK